ncbi:SAM-dependent methyltransferase [Pseudonocardia acaciae]|uniref:SAM-dependent methyltransferase n=1 Tax=Pseudonocardia acaciae TaxID=551276 RepID=UPI00048AD84F|nr:SAM-dependent methyltransferase [Pseudonocardia acaciae]
MTDAINPELAAKIRFDVPCSARIWNYWMGGKDNYPVDREEGDRFAATSPGIVDMAKQSRQYLIRAVRFLASEAGMRQFLDLGTGLPTMQNTHEVAQAAAPESRIVYVDHDPMVLAHARALLRNTTPEGVTTYLDADLHDPDLIVSDVRNVLNLNRPVAVMFMGSLGHIADYERARSIVTTVMAAVPSGSYLVQYDGAATSEATIRAHSDYNETGAVPYIVRTPEQMSRFFDGLDLVEPGLVSISRWRPDPIDPGTPEAVDAYGGVARKP